MAQIVVTSAPYVVNVGAPAAGNDISYQLGSAQKIHLLAVTSAQLATSNQAANRQPRFIIQAQNGTGVYYLFQSISSPAQAANLTKNYRGYVGYPIEFDSAFDATSAAANFWLPSYLYLDGGGVNQPISIVTATSLLDANDQWKNISILVENFEYV